MYLINYYQLYINSKEKNLFNLFINNDEYLNKNHKDINYLLNEKRSKIINTNPTKYIFQLKNIKAKLLKTSSKFTLICKKIF